MLSGSGVATCLSHIATPWSDVHVMSTPLSDVHVMSFVSGVGTKN